MLHSKLDEKWTKPSMATLDEGFTWLGNRIVNAPSFKMKKQAASDHCSALQAIIFGPASDADVQTLTNSMVPEATAFWVDVTLNQGGQGARYADGTNVPTLYHRNGDSNLTTITGSTSCRILEVDNWVFKDTPCDDEYNVVCVLSQFDTLAVQTADAAFIRFTTVLRPTLAQLTNTMIQEVEGLRGHVSHLPTGVCPPTTDHPFLSAVQYPEVNTLTDPLDTPQWENLIFSLLTLSPKIHDLFNRHLTHPGVRDLITDSVCDPPTPKPFSTPPVSTSYLYLSDHP